MSFLSDHLNDDIARLIYARVHRMNFGPVLDEVRAFPGIPSVFERALRMGGDPVEALRRTNTHGDQDVRLFEDDWYAGSSKLLLFGRRFLLMYDDLDSDEGFLSSEAIYEGFLEGRKIKIERAYTLTRYRNQPDVECESLEEILAADGFVDAGGYETDPGQRWGVGPFRDAVDVSYHSGREWQDLAPLQRWYYPPREFAESDSAQERRRKLYDNERVRRTIEHEESMRQRRRARRGDEARRRRRREDEDERFQLELRTLTLLDGERDERTRRMLARRSEEDGELRRLAEMALEADREICRFHDDGMWRLRDENWEEIAKLKQAADSEQRLREQENEQKEKEKEKETAERSMSRADRATTWRRG